MHHRLSAAALLLALASSALGQVIHIPSLAISGNSAFDLFGFTVSSAGDVNNDGIDDFIVGSRQDGNALADSGIARVFFSVVLPAAPTACPGDVTGDNIVNFADLNSVLSNFGATCPK